MRPIWKEQRGSGFHSQETYDESRKILFRSYRGRSKSRDLPMTTPLSFKG